MWQIFFFFTAVALYVSAPHGGFQKPVRAILVSLVSGTFIVFLLVLGGGQTTVITSRETGPSSERKTRRAVAFYEYAFVAFLDASSKITFHRILERYICVYNLTAVEYEIKKKIVNIIH